MIGLTPASSSAMLLYGPSVRRWTRFALVCAMLVFPQLAGLRQSRAQTPPPPADPAQPAKSALQQEIAVLWLEALGMDPEPVARLETLFRMELERLAGRDLPTHREVMRALRSSRKLRRCAGANKCLAAIGKKLGVDLVVTGNVAALGDSYVINIKVVNVQTGEQQGDPISSQPLRGSPDQLIEAVRSAAYTLLAPDQVRGSIMVLTDMVGASVKLDGQQRAVTPLTGPITDLRPGEYELSVEADGYIPFKKKVRVRFQKTTRVVVRLAPEKTEESPVVAPVVIKKRPAPKRWYSSTWFYVGAGVAAAILGGYVGYKLAHDPVVDCSADPSQCGGI